MRIGRDGEDWCAVGKPRIFLDGEEVDVAHLVYVDDEIGVCCLIDFSKQVPGTHGYFSKEVIDAAGNDIPMIIKHGKVEYR